MPKILAKTVSSKYMGAFSKSWVKTATFFSIPDLNFLFSEIESNVGSNIGTETC